LSVISVSLCQCTGSIDGYKLSHCCGVPLLLLHQQLVAQVAAAAMTQRIRILRLIIEGMGSFASTAQVQDRDR